MEFVGHVLLAAFVALVLVAAVTFGFALLMWFVAFAIAVSVIIMLREWFLRLRFLYWARDRKPPRSPKVIDADYRDISDKS